MKHSLLNDKKYTRARNAKSSNGTSTTKIDGGSLLQRPRQCKWTANYRERAYVPQTHITKMASCITSNELRHFLLEVRACRTVNPTAVPANCSNMLSSFTLLLILKLEHCHIFSIEFRQYIPINSFFFFLHA